ncbi:hypothetical protein GCM10027275_26570 [Rhabdobacter roseus]|uniref:Iron complex outermembrane receptor protein n=1 Tax=Rhabdobacter roseus TaxID=1655419 RepID=A0A840TMI0_9BACT|nr:TonB-dependent receptor [Rhabdobacter roseus]MBB5284604.1 iron complex outermembrane receptor protein [Rhabdobacter roseus]
MKGFLLVLLGCFTSTLLLAQSGQIKGIITSKDGQPAGYVNVLLEGTQQGTTTQADGSYSFTNLPEGTYVLTASFIGLQAQSETVALREGEIRTIHFTLKENSRQLQEVIVFANANKYKADYTSKSLRLMSPILETPQNIQVIGRQIIADQQVFDMLEGIQRNVSGAQKVEHWDNYALIYMRGAQITAFRNGMNVQMPWGPLAEDMSMVERIEFVKGPAGFMLANGEPSGFYNVVTKKPSGIEKGEASFSLGSFDTYRTTLDLDGKLSKSGKLLYRLNLMGQLKGSHRDFEYNNRYSVVPVIKYLIDEKSALTLEYTYQFSEMSVIGSNYAFSNRGYADLPRNFTTAEANLAPSRINDQSILGIFEHFFNEKWKLTAQMAYFNYDQVGQSIWPWGISQVDNRSMQRGISIWDALGMTKTGQIFLNGSAQTGGISHNLLGGIDMSQKDYYADWNQGAALGDSTFNIYNPVYGTVAAADIPVWDRSLNIRERGVRYNTSYSSFYAQDEIGLFQNKLRLTLAGRFTHHKDMNPYNPSTDDSKFTPRAGLSYSINKQTSAYFVYDQAFVSNPGRDWQGRSFDPITGNNLEVGFKRNWFGGRWNSTFAAYRIIKNNVLTTDTQHPDPTTGQFVFSRQTGQQQVEGVEADIKGELLPHLDLILNYAYTDAQITKDSDESVVGNQVPGATRHIHNAWISYTLPQSTLKGLKFSLGYQYQAGRSSWYIFDNSQNALPDYFRLDGGLSYQTPTFGVTLNVNNLLNEYLYSGAPYGSTYYWQTEPGRNARLSISYRF